jgi:hypothetical protein
MTKDEKKEWDDMKLQLALITRMLESEFGTLESQGKIPKQIENINDKVGKIYKLLYGNGDTDKSIVVQLALVKKDVKRTAWAASVLFVAFIGTMVKMFAIG